MIKPIFGLWRRDLIKMFRNRPRLLGGLAQPLMYLCLLGLGMNDVFKAAGHGSYSRFLSPGIVAMTVITNSFVSGFSVLWDRKFGFLKESLISPTPRSAIVIGRSLGAATTATLQAIMVLALSFSMTGILPTPSDIVATVIATLLVGTTLGLLGMFFGTVIDDFQAVQLLINFVLMPLIFLSGALFPQPDDRAGTTLAALVKWNPVSYLVDLLRWSMGFSAHFSASADMEVCAVLLVGCFVLCLKSFKYVDVM